MKNITLYKKQIIIFFLAISIMMVSLTAMIVETRSHLLQAKANVYMSRVIEDRSPLENSFRILKDGCTWYVDNNLNITGKRDNNMVPLIQIGDVILDTDYEIFVEYDGYLLVDDNIGNVLFKLLWYGALFSFILIVIMLLLLDTSVSKERDHTLKILLSNEALSSSKTTIMITENVHHELNTPMEVIENKIAKIQDFLLPVLLNEDLFVKEYALEINDDFELIAESAELVHNVLNSMKEYKHLRYSNGNKTLYDIINGAFSILNYTTGNFNYEVDVRLKLYKLDDSTFRNATLVNIILNHLKNSLSANSTKIIVLFDKIEKGICTFRIIDNGNGIAKKNIAEIFKPNFSTKDVPGEISGNGLFLNKTILTEHSGGLKLIDTSTLGTTFGIGVPAILR